MSEPPTCHLCYSPIDPDEVRADYEPLLTQAFTIGFDTLTDYQQQLVRLSMCPSCYESSLQGLPTAGDEIAMNEERRREREFFET